MNQIFVKFLKRFVLIIIRTVNFWMSKNIPSLSFTFGGHVYVRKLKNLRNKLLFSSIVIYTPLNLRLVIGKQ